MGKLDEILAMSKAANSADDANYAAWGDEAKMAKSQGWYKEVDFNGEMHYKSNYDAAFNKVVVPGQDKLGYIAVIGRKNNKMDVVIKDAGGNFVQKILDGVTPTDVQNYTKKLVGSRDASIREGKNPDKMDAKGGYTAL